MLLKSHGKDLTPGQAQFARDDSEWQDKSNLDLLSVIRKVKPHVLIGTSTKPKAFTEEAVKEMSKHVERPMIFPLSNPTRLHEADPKDINDWSLGKALIATGSPFPPVVYEGVEYEIGTYEYCGREGFLPRPSYVVFLNSNGYDFPFPGVSGMQQRYLFPWYRPRGSALSRADTIRQDACCRSPGISCPVSGASGP